MEPYDKNADYSNTSILVQGFAGSNKTGELVRYHKKWINDKLIAKSVAFTNVARENLIKRGIKQDNASTLHLMLGLTTTDRMIQTSNKIDRISVDEYSMLSENLYIKLHDKIKKISQKREPPLIH